MKYLIFIIAFFLISCDNVCVYEIKDVDIVNNTAYELEVVVFDNINSLGIGSLKPFEIKTFKVQHSLILIAGNDDFIDQIYIDPCIKDLELVVED